MICNEKTTAKKSPARRGEKSCIPDFTEEEIRLQKQKGSQLAEEITKAAKDLSRSSYTIAPGNYGFDFHLRFPFCNTDIAFCLENIVRPDDNPFTVKADDVTFWVQPTGKAFCYTSVALLLYHCENIRIEGLTLDEYVPNDAEGTVTEIDRDQNRICIRMTNSSLPLRSAADARKVAEGNQCRIIPFKADGRFINALYKIDPHGWGPGDCWIREILPAEKENEYWLYFKTDLLIKTITSKEWEMVYGTRGTLKIGDVIAIVFGNINITLSNSRKIGMIRFTSHLSKCMPCEVGGYGAHFWKDCCFAPKEGTSKCLNGCEGMFCHTRHGTTIENTFIHASSDDHINIHGMWSKILSVSGHTAEMENVSEGCLIGDPVKFYDKEGRFLKETRLAEIPCGGKAVLSDEIPASFAGMWARFPCMECDGWTIRNCTLSGNYQRYLLQCGNGIFENNKVYDLGETFSVVNELGDVYVEGGLLKNITFRNNVICSSAVCPGARVFKFAQNAQWEKKLMAGKMEIADNLFINCGMLAEGKNITSISFKNNIVIEPVIYAGKITAMSELYGRMINVDRFSSENNDLYTADCTENTQNSDRTHPIDPALTEKIRCILENTEKEAKDIIAVIKCELKA